MKKRLLYIFIVIFAVLILSGIIGYFVYTNKTSANENINLDLKNFKTGTELGDLYLDALKKDTEEQTVRNIDSSNIVIEERKENILSGASNVNIAFFKFDSNSKDVMIVLYEKEGSNRLSIYYQIPGTEEYKTIATSKYPAISFNNDTYTDFDLKLLYNILADEYRWYINGSNADGDEEFLDLQLLVTGNTAKNETDTIKYSYSFKADEITKIDETFIKPEITEYNKIKVNDILEGIDKTTLAKYITDAMKNTNYTDKIVTEKVKFAVEEKKNEIANNKKIAEEKTTQEAEAKTEETRKSENEYIKVGNYTLKYGTYKCRENNTDFVLTLNSDGTCSYSGPDIDSGSGNKNLTGNVTVTQFDNYINMVDGIKIDFSDASIVYLEAISDNKIGNQWLIFNYTGN